MIPLSLKLVEKEVQVDGKTKTVRVLNLTAPYSLIEIQRYAQIPPGQVLLLPAPDSEAPDDLFPNEVAGPVAPTKPVAGGNKALAELWTKTKSKVWQLDVRDSQIADWFRRNYHLDVRLSDFDLIEPPSHVTAESLEHFLKTLKRQADQM